MGEGAVLIIAGVVIGVAGALALTGLLQGLLFGVHPTDAATFVAMCAVLMAVALVACWIPAFRATHMNCLTALRHD